MNRRKLLKAIAALRSASGFAKSRVGARRLSLAQVTMIVPLPAAGQARFAAGPVGEGAREKFWAAVIVDNRAGWWRRIRLAKRRGRARSPMAIR